MFLHFREEHESALVIAGPGFDLPQQQLSQRIWGKSLMTLRPIGFGRRRTSQREQAKGDSTAHVRQLASCLLRHFARNARATQKTCGADSQDCADQGAPFTEESNMLTGTGGITPQLYNGRTPYGTSTDEINCPKYTR